MALRMMPGFGNDFETEALPGALPQGQNSPQRGAYGLYAEQLSGSPFTAPRGTNERSWLYRIRPVGAAHRPLPGRRRYPHWKTAPHIGDHDLPLGQLRWEPGADAERSRLTFLTGMRTMTTAGDVNTQAGMAAHVYLANRSMVDELFLQRRRRAADRAAAGRPSLLHRARRASSSSPARSASSRAA